MGLNNAQKYAKFLKEEVSHSIFFHKSDEMADFVPETHVFREKWQNKGGNGICDSRTMVMQMEVPPLTSFAAEWCGVLMWGMDRNNKLPAHLRRAYFAVLCRYATMACTPNGVRH